MFGRLAVVDPIAHQIACKMVGVDSARIIHSHSAFFRGAIPPLADKAVPALLRDVTGN